jgi:hypothetical protein
MNLRAKKMERESKGMRVRRVNERRDLEDNIIVTLLV